MNAVSDNIFKYFGWLETLGGFIKICLVLGVGVFMFVVHGQSASPVPPSLYRQLTLADPPSSQCECYSQTSLDWSINWEL